MSVDVTYPHITKENGKPARLTRMPRIRVSQIVGPYLFHGWSVDEICRQYPHLRRSEAYIAMAYYFDHQEEIDQELQQEREEVERMQAKGHDSPFYQRMKKEGRL